MAITGLWSGQLQSSGGGTEAVTYRFSPNGNPVLGFQTRKGLREIEIRAVGQQQEWLLPGSGWARGTVKALAVAPDHVQAVVSVYSESGGGALLDQRERVLGVEFVQSGNAVKATVVIEATSYSSGNGLGLYAGRRTRNVLSGVLYPQ
jgi:hypothetical protein